MEARGCVLLSFGPTVTEGDASIDPGTRSVLTNDDIFFIQSDKFFLDQAVEMVRRSKSLYELS